MIFISYRHEDTRDLAGSLADKLTAHFGQGSVFLDRGSIPPGHDWRVRIAAALDDSQVVLAVIGSKWLRACDQYGRRRIDLEDDVLAYELATALDRHIPVIPLYIDGTAPLLREALPKRLEPLEGQQSMAFEMPRDFAHLTDLLQTEHHLVPSTRQAYREWLKPLSFEAEKSKHLPEFTGRQWVEERLDNWIQRRRSSRVFCLLGGPGIGKSAIACHWSHTRRDVIAFHHCVHDYPEKIDPRRTLFSLAAQVAEHLPEYEQRLAAFGRSEMQNIVKGGAHAVFENLLLKPLKGFPAPDGDRLIVIDGIDEATKGDTNELAKVIGKAWVGLPDWLRLVVTARPELDVRGYLSSLHPFILHASSPENMGDVRMFLRRQLTPDQASDEMINEIVAKSEGMFLYARVVLDEIGSERLTLDRIADFPQGLTGYYEDWFRRKFPDAELYREQFHKLVSVIVAQKGPLPLEVLSNAVGQRMYDLQMRLMRLGVLFPQRDEKQGDHTVTYVTLMHKSLYDWLTGKRTDGRFRAGVFASDIELGNHLLAEEGWRVYGKGSLETDPYFREALPAHLAEDKQSEKLATVLLDSHLVDSLWYTDSRVEWQRYISSLRHDTSLSLSKLVHDWLAGRDSPQRRTAVDALVAGKLCRLFQEIGAFDEAMALGEAALRIWGENKIENSPEMVGTYLAVGEIQSKREQLDHATESHEKALEIANRTYAPDSPQMADALYRMCVFYSSSKRDYKKATACLDRCYEIYRRCSPPDLVGMANCINDRAVIYTREQRAANNLALYREALALFERATPRGHPEMVSTLSNVAHELNAVYKQSEALPLLRRAVAMAEVVLLPQHEYSRSSRTSLCSTLLFMGRDEEALAVMRQYVAEHERYPGKDHVDMADARLALCHALWRAVLSAEASVASSHRSEILQQCQLIRRAKPGTIEGLLDLANVARKASEMGLYGPLREAARRACRSETEPMVNNERSASLPAACYGQIVELALSDQPLTKIGPAILDIWQREAPKLEQRADLLPQTRKAIIHMIAWYGRTCLDHSDDIESVREAFNLITQVGADSPETLDQLASLAVSLHLRRLDETSEVLCERLLERAESILGPDHIQTLTYLDNLAFLKMSRNKFKEASILFQRLLQAHLRESGQDGFGAISAVTHMAECLLLQGYADEARRLIRDFAAKFPESEGQTSPRQTLAAVLNQAGMRQKNQFARFEAARTCYELSLEFYPDDATVHSNFALLLWACLHENDEADLHFRRSLEINDRNDAAQSVYGLFLGQTRDELKGAIEHFEKAAAINPNATATLANHASVLLAHGEINAAWAKAKHAMRFCQPNPDRMMSRALFAGAAALLLLGKDPCVPLGQLKTLFARRIEHAPWVITALLKRLQRQLSSDSFTFVNAISAAIDDKEQLAQLVQNPVWQSIKALPLDVSWPGI